MNCVSLYVSEAQFDSADFASLRNIEPQLVLAFFSLAAVRHATLMARLQRACPGAHLIGCSSGGEIAATSVSDNGVAVHALRFTRARLRTASSAFSVAADSLAAGSALAKDLAAADLRAVIVFAQSVDVDASALIDSLAAGVGSQVGITGGLAADNAAPVNGMASPDQAPALQSWTLLDGQLASDRCAAVGLYGDGVRIASGMAGGAKPFGPVRTITRASGSVLYELDGEPALDIYRRYLGPYAKDLPASGLMFPFALLDDELRDTGLIRTLVAIDESERSLVLVGDLVPGSHLRLMHASTARLVSGAAVAARAVCPVADTPPRGVAILISCVDRKLVMGSRVDDEIEAVADVFGASVTLAGFYANGEFGTRPGSPDCRLNNQALAITYLSE